MVPSHAEPSPPPSPPLPPPPPPPSPSSSWSRMQSELENPFQNNPGRFIYALPDLCSSSQLTHPAVGCCSPDEPSTCSPQQISFASISKGDDEGSSIWDESQFDLDIPFYLSQRDMEFHLRAEQRDDSVPPTPTCPESRLRRTIQRQRRGQNVPVGAGAVGLDHRLVIMGASWAHAQ
ncbi:hypothetical protein BGW80DRAFT_605894 [Lactifluus volemus]|nr:hypothetical protein BGW80DRAFT_605894 [Lactifluus volemus]